MKIIEQQFKDHVLKERRFNITKTCPICGYSEIYTLMVDRIVHLPCRCDSNEQKVESVPWKQVVDYINNAREEERQKILKENNFSIPVQFQGVESKVGVKSEINVDNLSNKIP